MRRQHIDHSRGNVTAHVYWSDHNLRYHGIVDDWLPTFTESAMKSEVGIAVIPLNFDTVVDMINI